MRQVSTLTPYARNSRTHSDEQIGQIADSIRQWGWTIPVLITEGGQIIAGHGRVEAAKRLGIATVPTLVARGWTAEQIRAYVIADNSLPLNAGWDPDLLKAEITDLLGEGFNVDLLGFSDKFLDNLLGDPSPGLTDEDDAPEAPEQPVTRPGDVWVMGDHRIICGDCTHVDVIERVMAGAQADLLHTDPPYGVTYSKATAERKKRWAEIKGDDLKGAQLQALVEDAIAAALPSLKPGAPWYVWHPSNATDLFCAAIRAMGRKPGTTIIWVKNQMAGGFADYRPRHEPCLYVTGGRATWYGGRSQDTIWEVSRERNYQHPTQKPVELVERALLNSSKEGDLVLDPFSGSGSTILACAKTGRRARAVELAPAYVDVAVLRWQAFMGEAAHLEATGETFDSLSTSRQKDAA